MLKLFCFHCCNHSHRAFASIHESVETGHFSSSALYIKSVGWPSVLQTASPAAVFAPCYIGLHTVAFYSHCFSTIQQDPSVNKAYCFSFSISYCTVGPLQQVSFLSLLIWTSCPLANQWSLPRFLDDWDFLFKFVVWSVWPIDST